MTRHRKLYVASVVFNAELLLAALYVVVGGVTLGALRYSLYGLLWVGVGVFVVATTRTAPASSRTRRRAALLAVGYFAVLAYFGGLIAAGSPTGPGGLRVALLPPGWGPALVYSNDLVALVLMPARVVGYLALAYLVYATAIDAAGAAVSGVVGLFSCVSCSWPILFSLLSGVFGAGSGIAGTALALSYDLSTLVFLATVALLYWRPFWPSAPEDSAETG